MEEKAKSGYKKTKIGWIPEDWTCLTFGEIVLKSQYGLSLSSSENGNFPIFKMNNFDYGKMSAFNLDKVEITTDEFETYRLNKGEILFNRTNSFDLVGKTGIFDLDGDYVFASYLVKFIIKADKATPYFVNYFLNWDYTQKRIKAIATKGVSQVNINPTNLKNWLKIPIPPFAEQKKIAEILSTWDRAIEKTRALIAAKEQQKKALMQQLLTGKKRFREFEDNEWMEMALKDFLIPTFREVDKPTAKFLALGVRSHCKGTFHKPDFDPSQIEMEKLYLVKENDLILNITFAWEGAIAIVKSEDDCALVSHRFPTYTFNAKLVTHNFFKFVIVQRKFRYLLGLISPGGAGRNRVLSKKGFLRIKRQLPSLAEQQKIAAVLQTSDKEIGLLRQKLAALEKQKKGLMQVLLTGKVRVKI